jgi:hypothetical protein
MVQDNRQKQQYQLLINFKEKQQFYFNTTESVYTTIKDNQN